MAGQLSPDGLYYWDGGRWVSAVSPDGGWRWDGHTWRPARARRTFRYLWVVIALVVVASLVVASFGVYQLTHWALTRTQAYLQTNGVGLACTESGAMPGAPLAEHDVVCGRHLGTSYYRADCLAPGTPNGARFIDAVGTGDWQDVDVTSDGSGCPVNSDPDHTRMFTTMDPQPASSTLIVDFVAQGWEGGMGVQLACSDSQSCIDFSLYGDGYFSVDQGNAQHKFDQLTSGHLGTFTGQTPETGIAYRLILRLDGRAIAVFLNGHEVAHVDATVDQGAGYATFYTDGRETTGGEAVLLQRVFVFQTLGS